MSSPWRLLLCPVLIELQHLLLNTNKRVGKISVWQLYNGDLYPINFILVVIIVIIVCTTTENHVKLMVWNNFFFCCFDLRFVEKGNLEVQLFILTSKLRANHQKMYTPPENKALSDINKVCYFILFLSLNTVTGLSEVAGCRRKSPTT